MAQAIFFALFIVALLAGIFAYLSPPQKPIDPLAFITEKSGFNMVEASHRKKTQQINMITSKGIMQIRGKMDELALKQSQFLDTLEDQQQILKNAGKNASDILLAAKKAGEAGNQDILQLEALLSQMQDQQRLLVDRGRELISLNDQLTQDRQLIAEQIDLAKINTEDSLRALRDRAVSLNDKASEVFEKAAEHNQEVRDQIDRTQSKLRDMANNAAHDSALQQQNIKDRIQGMLDKEHEDMIKLADMQERNRNFLRDAQERQAQAKELLNDKLQQERDMIEQEHQKAQDQQETMKQRIADEKQRVQDQQK